MSKFTSLVKKLYYDKRVRFLFVGGLNTIVGVGTTYIIYLCFGLPLFSQATIPPLPMIVGTLTGQVVGTIHSYFWNKYFTFRSKEKSGKEFLRFVGVYAVQYLVTLGLTKLFDILINIPSLVTIVTTFVGVILSYIGHNFFSFRKTQTADKQEEKEE
ncbi:MAG: GtrA family protein [Clostridiales bacterium]|nr:GtrA family protein [Clostridiales bacterium]